MNTTKDAFRLNILGSFAPSGFFKNSKVRANKPVKEVYRIKHEAATPAQTARLNGVLSRGL